MPSHFVITSHMTRNHMIPHRHPHVISTSQRLHTYTRAWPDTHIRSLPARIRNNSTVPISPSMIPDHDSIHLTGHIHKSHNVYVYADLLPATCRCFPPATYNIIWYHMTSPIVSDWLHDITTRLVTLITYYITHPITGSRAPDDKKWAHITVHDIPWHFINIWCLITCESTPQRYINSNHTT